MTLAGYLSEYSLAEILNFVHEGSRTGLLSISADLTPVATPLNPHYLWFQSGRIVAVAGLLGAISQRKLIPSAQIEQLRTQVDKLSQPLGLYLKSRGLLNAEQLKLLFNSQAIAVVCKLFEMNNGRFYFDPCILPFSAEMTGISLPAQEIGLLGLRVLKDWSNLAQKLPDPDYALQRWSSQLPSFRLDRHEAQLWKLADGETALNKLTAPMSLSVDALQKIGFRLIAFGLVQEIPTEVVQPALDLDMAMPELVPIRPKAAAVSTSFLGNLMGFLKKKG
jgi:Domain of unknown function (DUF4388)